MKTYAPERTTARRPRCCARCRTPYNCGNARCRCHMLAVVARMCAVCSGKGETCGQPFVKCHETGVMKGGK